MRGASVEAFDRWPLRVLLQYMRGLLSERRDRMEPFVWFHNATFGGSVTVDEVFGIRKPMALVENAEIEAERRMKKRIATTERMKAIFPEHFPDNKEVA